MAEKTITITTVTVSVGANKQIKLRLNGQDVSIPVEPDLYAYFKSHFVRANPSQKQKDEYSTVMRLMSAAYSQGLKDNS